MDAIDLFCDRSELLPLFELGLEQSIETGTLLRWLKNNSSLSLNQIRSVFTHSVLFLFFLLISSARFKNRAVHLRFLGLRVGVLQSALLSSRLHRFASSPRFVSSSRPLLPLYPHREKQRSAPAVLLVRPSHAPGQASHRRVLALEEQPARRLVRAVLQRRQAQPRFGIGVLRRRDGAGRPSVQPHAERTEVVRAAGERSGAAARAADHRCAVPLAHPDDPVPLLLRVPRRISPDFEQ